MKKGWQTKRLGDVAVVGAGNSAPQDQALFKDGTIPFFRTADAGRVRFGDISESTDYLNDKGVKGLRRFAPGTILFPKSGASTFLNHRVMLGVEGCVSSHLATVVADDKQAHPRFLLYFLSTIAAQDLVQDHAYPSLNLPTIAGIEVQTPPLPEQHRIVGILDEAFTGLATAKANAEKNLQNARTLFESHLQSVFSQRGKGWVETTVGQHVDFLAGFAFKSSHYTDSEDGVRLVRGDNIVQGEFRWDGVKRWPKKSAADYSQFAFEENDVVLAMDRPWVAAGLKVAVVTKSDLPSLQVQRTARLRAKSSLHWKYLFHLIRSSSYVAYLLDGQTGLGVPHISGKQILSFEFPLPPLAEQKKIVANLDSLRKETQRLAAIYQQKLAALEALKKSLLHQAFSGEL